MLEIAIERDDQRPLVDQVVDGIARAIDDRSFVGGAKVPSIRGLSKSHGLSRFTVVEAYDRLVAMGYLQPRRGAGFFAVTREPISRETISQGPTAGSQHAQNEHLVWLIRRLLNADENLLLAGGPWLPNSWLEEAGVRRVIAAIARHEGPHVVAYGNPYGYTPLREHLALVLGEMGIRADISQIILTESTSHALELIIRRLLAPGDCALVDDPGYYNLFGNLRLSNVRMLAVPRTSEGPDVESLERLAAQHRPKVYFTQSVMQNPTNTDMSSHVSFKVLQIAERYGFRVVEDDIFADLQATPTPRLAAFDQLERVIYTRSFSKTLSGSLRMGFIACSAGLATDLADVKMLTSITSSQFVERVVYAMLTEGHYRKYLTRLQQRLDVARSNLCRTFERSGVEIFGNPRAGMFVWARFPNIEDSAQLAKRASSESILLAPGTIFRPHLDASPWMRFNVAVCDDSRFEDWVVRTAASSTTAEANANGPVRTSPVRGVAL